MTDLVSLWLPILVATLAVFMASSLVNTALPWHRKDLPRVPDEEGLRQALRQYPLAPGDYMVPRTYDYREMATPEYRRKVEEGPVMILTVFPNRVIPMSQNLTQWGIYCLAVSILTACIVRGTAGADAHGHDVFHYTALVAFTAYAAALWQMSIWYGRPWNATLKSTLDGLIYALITAGVFVWLWP